MTKIVPVKKVNQNLTVIYARYKYVLFVVAAVAIVYVTYQFIKLLNFGLYFHLIVLQVLLSMFCYM